MPIFVLFVLVLVDWYNQKLLALLVSVDMQSLRSSVIKTLLRLYCSVEQSLFLLPLAATVIFYFKFNRKWCCDSHSSILWRVRGTRSSRWLCLQTFLSACSINEKERTRNINWEQSCSQQWLQAGFRDLLCLPIK